jgi:hypothetical protein
MDPSLRIFVPCTLALAPVMSCKPVDCCVDTPREERRARSDYMFFCQLEYARAPLLASRKARSCDTSTCVPSERNVPARRMQRNVARARAGTLASVGHSG